MKNDDAELIERSVAGDQGAFAALMRKYQKQVHALAWRKIGDFHIAEEITQDTFLKAYRKLATLKNPKLFAGWLYVIANRQCIAWLQKKRLPMESLEAMPTAELEELAYSQYQAELNEEATTEQQGEIVKYLLQKLPESERTVIILHYLGGLTCEEISEFLGVSPNTIKSRLHRARKRLKQEEPMIRQTLGNFQISANLTENILREISRTKPTPPASNQPLVPWAVSFSTAILILLMIGLGTQHLTRFQQPYSLEATSETTVDIVDEPIVLPLKLKQDVRNQLGNLDTAGSGNGLSRSQADSLVAALQTEAAEVPVAKPQWMPTNGPEGTSGGRVGLFVTSEKTLYAVAARGLYKLTDDADAWTLICPNSPTQQFEMPMAERRNTLYIPTPDELLASTDEGKTWDAVGTRPKGRVIGLFITDDAFYLVFERHMFRSDDAGRSWIPMVQDLHALITMTNSSPDISISDAIALDNIVFVGTNQGLYRITTGVWEKLRVPGREFINSLVVSENRLYVITGPDFTRRSHLFKESRNLNVSVRILLPVPRVFRSTDLGNSWNDITPIAGQTSWINIPSTDGISPPKRVLGWISLPPTDSNSPLRRFSGLQLVPVGETLVGIGPRTLHRSNNSGDTWTDLGADPNSYALSQSVFPVVALDENNFYTADASGIARSRDGGTSWHPFITGMVNSDVVNLARVKNVIYALTPGGIVKSTDRGESWASVGVDVSDEVSLKGQLQKKHPSPNLLSHAKIAKAEGILYVSNSTSDNVALFHLSADGNVLMPVQRMPTFAEDTLEVEWEKKFEKAAPNMSDISRQHRADMPRIIEERLTNGGFAHNDETFFMEYRRKLLRWRHNETEWYDTGLIDTSERSPGADATKGFTLAVSGNTVYAGKRNGTLFQSLDSGDNWNDITASLPFSFRHFKEITFAASTVYVATDAGVMNSRDNETWHALTDADENLLIMDCIAVDDTTVYGVCEKGIYRIDNETGTWQQLASEVPYKATALAVDGNTFYIGTHGLGVLRLQLNEL